MSGQLLMPLIQARNAQAEQQGLLGASPWDTLRATQSPEQIEQMRRAGLLALDYATAVAPLGMITPGSWWKSAKVPTGEKLGRSANKFLHHSSSTADVADLARGIEPTNQGAWVREVAEGAADDAGELLRNATPLSWWSDNPTWVRMMVARKLGKFVGDVTDDEVLKHGHLAIISRKNPDAPASMFRVGESGLDNGPYSEVTDVTGRKMKAYEAGLFDDGMEPFGVERNEWVTTQTQEPLFQLTGQDLLDYLRAAGFPRGSTW